MPRGEGRRASRGNRQGLAIVRFLLAGLFVAPVVLMYTLSWRPPGLPPPSGLDLLLSVPAVVNYQSVADLLPVTRYALNSLNVVAFAVPITLLTASLAAYGLHSLPTRMRRPLLILSLVALMVPPAALWIPRLALYRLMGLLDTPGALIVPSLMGTSPLYVLMVYWQFRRIPLELYEAARLSGAGALRIWWQVAVPQARGVLAAVAALAFIHYWGNLMDPLLFLHRPEHYTLPVGVQLLHQLHPTRWPVVMAGAVLLTTPAIIALVVAQQFLLRTRRSHRMEGRTRRSSDGDFW